MNPGGFARQREELLGLVCHHLVYGPANFLRVIGGGRPLPIKVQKTSNIPKSKTRIDGTTKLYGYNLCIETKLWLKWIW